MAAKAERPKRGQREGSIRGLGPGRWRGQTDARRPAALVTGSSRQDVLRGHWMSYAGVGERGRWRRGPSAG